jgi:thiamine biosynthesis lipoprotein
MSLTRRRLLSALGGFVGGVVLRPDLRGLGLLVERQERTIFRHVPALGTRVSFLVDHPDRALADHAIRRAIRAIFSVHEAMTLHEPSPLTWLNAHGLVRPVEVPESLLTVLLSSRQLHSATGGLFDATLSGEGAGRGPGWRGVFVDEANRRVGLGQPELALDFNGIAKGYAVDCAAAVLRGEGIGDFLINAGGDLYASGSPWSEPRGWTIRLEAPAHNIASPRKIRVTDQAVATSGNWMQPRDPEGQPISHLVHPLGDALGSRMVSATAIAASAMEADAWATAAFVGGPSQMAAFADAPGNPELHFLEKDGWLPPIGGHA